MSKKRWFAGSLMMVALPLFALGLALWQGSQRTTSKVVRDDTVRGGNGKLYRRLVRVDHNRLRKTVTTTVTFTDVATGGVGRAVYTQPDTRPPSSYDYVKASVMCRVGLGQFVRMPSEFPLMYVPQPIEAGQKWGLRIVPIKDGWYTEGSGKAPPGAGFSVSPSQLPAVANAGDYYGIGASL